MVWEFSFDVINLVVYIFVFSLIFCVLFFDDKFLEINSNYIDVVFSSGCI